MHVPASIVTLGGFRKYRDHAQRNPHPPTRIPEGIGRIP